MAEVLTCTRRDPAGIATVMARKGVQASAIGKALGVSLTDESRVTCADGFVLVGTGPGSWLAIANDAPPLWADDIARRLTETASVSDQTGGYAVFSLRGQDARELLQRGAFVDLEQFHVGSAATTVIAHIGVILWQVDALPSFEVAVFRSFAASFLDWKDEASTDLLSGR